MTASNGSLDCKLSSTNRIDRRYFTLLPIDSIGAAQLAIQAAIRSSRCNNISALFTSNYEHVLLRRKLDVIEDDFRSGCISTDLYTEQRYEVLKVLQKSGDLSLEDKEFIRQVGSI